MIGPRRASDLHAERAERTPTRTDQSPIASENTKRVRPQANQTEPSAYAPNRDQTEPRQDRSTRPQPICGSTQPRFGDAPALPTIVARHPRLHPSVSGGVRTVSYGSHSLVALPRYGHKRPADYASRASATLKCSRQPTHPFVLHDSYRYAPTRPHAVTLIRIHAYFAYWRRTRDSPSS